MQDQHPDAQGKSQADEGEDRGQCRSPGQALGEQPDRTEGVERCQGRQASENAIE
jgi:hypothetical protein